MRFPRTIGYYLNVSGFSHLRMPGTGCKLRLATSPNSYTAKLIVTLDLERVD